MKAEITSKEAKAKLNLPGRKVYGLVVAKNEIAQIELKQFTKGKWIDFAGNEWEPKQFKSYVIRWSW
jgi:hypothetical protein